MTEIEKIQKEISELVGPVTVKNLFNGYGFFKKKRMFAIYINNAIFIRGKGQLAEYFKKSGAASFIAKMPHCNIKLKDYYRFPISVITNKSFYKIILQLSIQQTLYLYEQEMLKKLNRIKELPNLSIKHERLLAKIGVFDVKEFQEKGPVWCFVQLRKEGFSVNLKLFWALLGALHNCHQYVLPDEVRVEALIELNNTLDEANLKPYPSLLLEDYRKGKITRLPFYNIYD